MLKILSALFLLSITSTSAQAVCSNNELSLRGDFGKVSFAVDVVDTVDSRAQGLMFVDSMPMFTGMLFVYERPQQVAFWMKNTLIPLDMIFIDESGTVKRVHTKAVPGDLTPIQGGTGIFAVLEINGGVAQQLGITAGSQVMHGAFADSDPVWPCD